MALTSATSAQPLTSAPIAVAPAFMPSGESTRAACTDGIDNDGDGHVDCADQDCQDFTFCAAVVGAKADSLARLRGKGTTRVVIGAVMLSLGVVVGAISTWLWLLGTSGDSAYYAGGIAMDTIGFLMIGGGTALLAVGAGNLAEARRPRLALDGNGVGVRF